MQAAIVGLAGDTLTLGGGLLLALDAIRKEKDFDEIKELAKTVKDPRLARLRLVMEGVELSSESGPEKAILRRSAWRAKWGCILLLIGFAVLVASRLIEIFA
jgi:hypothetical protein